MLGNPFALEPSKRHGNPLLALAGCYCSGGTRKRVGWPTPRKRVRAEAIISQPYRAATFRGHKNAATKVESGAPASLDPKSRMRGGP